MMIGRFPRRSAGTQSDEDEFPYKDSLSLVLWGVVGASVFIVLGIIGIANGESPWPTNDFPLRRFQFQGTKAIAVCCFYFAIGLGLHFHYFWGVLKVRFPFIYGRRAAGYLAIGSLAYLGFSIVMDFRNLV